jgi:hypothetical protein
MKTQFLIIVWNGTDLSRGKFFNKDPKNSRGDGGCLSSEA